MKRNNIIRKISMMLACLLISQALPTIGFASSPDYTVEINDGGGQCFGNVDTTIYSYTVPNVTTAGVYKLKASLKESEADTRDGHLKFMLGNQYITYVYSNPHGTNYAEFDVGYFYLEEGNNLIQITNHARGGYDNYPWCKSFSLTYCDGYEKEDYVSYILEAESSATDAGAPVTEYGNEKVEVLHNDKYCTFTFNAPENGKYEIVANSCTTTSTKTIAGTIEATGYPETAFEHIFAINSATAYEDVVLGEFNMLAGENTFTVKVNTGYLRLDYCTIRKVDDYIPDTSLGQNAIILAGDKVSSTGTVNEVEGKLEMTDATVEFDAEAGDEYNDYMLSLSCKGAPTAVKVYVNDSLFATRTDINNTSYADVRIGAIHLPEGDNTIKIEVVGTMSLSKLNFNSYTVANMTKTESSEEPITFVATEAFVSAESSLAVNEGAHIGTSSGGVATFSFEIPDGKAGLYEFDLLYTTGNSNRTLTAAFDEAVSFEHAASPNPSQEERYIGNVDLSAGAHKLTITNGASLWSQYISFKFTPVYTGVNYIASFGNDDNLLNGSLVDRGIDTIDIYYDNDIKAQTVTAQNITLKEKVSQEAVDYALVVDENKISIKLKETLAYETAYELSISNLSNIYSTVAENKIIEFTTGTDSDDEGRGITTIEDYSIEKVEGTEYHAIITGVVTYEADHPIKGRKVTLYNELSEEVANAITGENGVYSLDYDMTGFEMGRYNYTVKDEYTSSAAPIEILYYEDDDKADLCGSFTSLTEAADIKSKLEEYEIVLGVDCSEDEEILTDNGGDADLFYGHFANKTFDEVSDVEDFYNKALNYETMVQAVDQAMVETVLGDADKAASIGIDKAITDKITGANRDSFITDVIAIADTRDMDTYLADLNEVINDALAAQYEKTSVAPSLSTIRVNEGQAAVIPVKFAEELEDVKKVDFVVNVSGPANIGTIKLVPTTGYTGAATKDVNQVTGSVQSAEVVTEDEFAKLSVTIPKVGSYTATMTGTITYIVDGATFTVEIPSTSATITASKRSNSGNDGGGNFAGVAYPDYTNQETEEPTTPVEQEYRFNDLANVSWAEEYIYDLLDKGIISESDSNTFNPQRATTREEFIKMIVIAMEIDTADAECDFADVNTSDWFYQYVAAASNNGIINGIGDNKFGTGMNISRQDLSCIIKNILESKGMQLEITQQEKYADDDEIADYAKDAIYLMRELGIMEGVGNNTVAPRKTATRAEVAVVISRVMEVVNK